MLRVCCVYISFPQGAGMNNTPSNGSAERERGIPLVSLRECLGLSLMRIEWDESRFSKVTI